MVAQASRLFTPGPLSTSRTVREAQLEDMGSRNADFISLIAEIRAGVLKVSLRRLR